MKRALLLAISLSAVNSYAQKTITNKDFKGRIYEQYQVNANGDYHGTYVKYFNNGIVEEQATYSKGKLRSKKSYEYIGKQRYLVFDATYDTKGGVLTKSVRPCTTSDVLSDKIPAMIQVAGLLKSGRWSFWPGQETYLEKYNGNDTIYEWKDNTKKQFLGKTLDGKRILTKEELAIRLKADIDKQRQDSLESVKAEENRLVQESQRKKDDEESTNQYAIGKARRDSIQYGDNYVRETYNEYITVLGTDFNRNEATFYNKLVNYVTNKNTMDTTLLELIAKAIGISSKDFSKYKIDLSYTNDPINPEFGIWLEAKKPKELPDAVMLCCGNIRDFNKMKATDKQRKSLLAIIKYTKDNNIEL